MSAQVREEVLRGAVESPSLEMLRFQLSSTVSSPLLLTSLSSGLGWANSRDASHPQLLCDSAKLLHDNIFDCNNEGMY